MDSPAFLLLLDQRGNRFRLIDNLDSGPVDNIPDIPRLSTNEKAGVGGVAAESGRMLNTHCSFTISTSVGSQQLNEWFTSHIPVRC